ncbi:hypothetical protein MKX08_005488 [Trichoderma sp. CBMAI-0020]|nr:hypothetical protein MKX08_005488 [Trichoderma sp. CBMAI-0020]
MDKYMRNMTLESAMPETAIDPQLQLLTGNPAAEAMPFSYSPASFEPWNSMFESMGAYPQAAQDPGMLDSDPYSDTASSFSLGNDQNAQYLMSPIQGASLNPDDSPSNTSIASTLEPGPGSKAETSANTDTNVNTNASNPSTKSNTSKATKTKKGRRRTSSASEKKEQVKQRNRVAASKCRQKKKVKVDKLKDMLARLEAQNNDLRKEFQKLREEIGQVKSDLINHTECHDPNINRWVENEAKGFVSKLVAKGERQRMESISSIDGSAMAAMQIQPLEGVSNMALDDPYMGLDQ